MKRCQWCAGEIRDSDETCHRCGHRLDQDPAPAWDDSELARIIDAADRGGEPKLGSTVAPIAPPPVPAPAPAATRGLNRVELLIVVLSIAAGAVVTTGVLMVRGASPEAATSHPDVGTVGAARPPDASPEPPAPFAVKWSHAGRSRWVTNPKKHVAFELPAENSVQAWMKLVEPLLVVRCVNRRIEAFVYTDTPARIEREDEDHTVGLAFDAEPQSAERWPDSAEHDALFAPDAAAFARRLMSARTLRFGFTPHNAAPVTVHFNVAGLADLLKPSMRQCGLQ